MLGPEESLDCSSRSGVVPGDRVDKLNWNEIYLVVVNNVLVGWTTLDKSSRAIRSQNVVPPERRVKHDGISELTCERSWMEFQIPECARRQLECGGVEASIHSPEIDTSTT